MSMSSLDNCTGITSMLVLLVHVTQKINDSFQNTTESAFIFDTFFYLCFVWKVGDMLGWFDVVISVNEWNENRVSNKHTSYDIQNKHYDH